MEPGQGQQWDALPEADGGPDVLTGRWVVTRVEGTGWAFIPGLPFAGVRELTFADGRCTITVEAKDRVPPVVLTEAAVAFDPTATPKGFDLTAPHSDQPWRWTYKLTQQGQLLLAFGDPKDGRPAGFDSTRHKITLLVCDRAPP